MRLWTVHPKYLDAKGLTAVWREGLLAQKVLRGETRGYRFHPQLERFKAHEQPLAAIALYLTVVLEEAFCRGYHFDQSKVQMPGPCAPIPTTSGQLLYEWERLKTKLRERDPGRYSALLLVGEPLPHPLFHIVPGEIEPWERQSLIDDAGKDV